MVKAKKAGKVFKIAVDGEGVKGFVSLRVLPYHQRLDIAKEFDSDADNIDQAKVLFGMLTENITDVDITHESGEVIKDLETLEYYKEGSEILNQMMPIILNGPPLGNLLKLS